MFPGASFLPSPGPAIEISGNDESGAANPFVARYLARRLRLHRSIVELAWFWIGTNRTRFEHRRDEATHPVKSDDGPNIRWPIGSRLQAWLRVPMPVDARPEAPSKPPGGSRSPVTPTVAPA